MDAYGGLSSPAHRTRSQLVQAQASSSRPLSAHGEWPQTARTGCKPESFSRRQKSQKTEAATLSAAFPIGGEVMHAEQVVDSFEDMVTESKTAVLVDFYAPWCGPCELMSRVVSDLSTELREDLKVVKVNTDHYPKLASKYRIQALPTCLLFRDGVLVDRVNGFMPESNFGRRIRFYVARMDKKFGRR